MNEVKGGVKKPKQTPESIREHKGPLPRSYYKDLEAKLDDSSRSKEKALDDAGIRHLDFVIDLQNKLVRISLGLATAFLVFMGWVYRDLNTSAGIAYERLNLAPILLVMGLLIAAAILLTLSNLISSRQQKAQKHKDLVDHKLEAYRAVGPNLPEFERDKERESRELDSVLSGHKKWGPYFRVAGIVLFTAGTVLGLIILMTAVNNEISRMDNPQQQLHNQDSVDNSNSG